MERWYLTGDGEEARSYSRAVVTRGGRLVHLAGVVDVDPSGAAVEGGPHASARAVLDRLREAMEAVGGELGDVVAMTVHLTDARYGDAFAAVRADYFAPERYPASTLVTCVALARPELTMEVTATAVVPD